MAVSQLGQKPALLECRQALGAALGAVEQEGVGLVEIPHHGSDRVLLETLQSAQTLEAVDDDIAPLLLDDDDRHLLAVFGQRRQQPALTLRPLETQPFEAAIELVKLKLHGPFLLLAGASRGRIPPGAGDGNKPEARITGLFPRAPRLGH